MGRAQHHRGRDHFGDEDASYVLLEEATYTYAEDDDLQYVIADMDERMSHMVVLYGFGTATIASGSTNVDVTHGAGYTPDAEHIRIIPTNSPTNDPGWFWISNLGGTTFRINVRSDPGSGGATFAWRVER